MNANEEDRMKQLLKNALRPVGEAGTERDLWPSMLQRLGARPAAVPWFDWALAGGLTVFAVVFPASIPVFLYYL
jgi:hypothetical protein